jgi:dTDP-4-dehydrorhamnose reductase
MKILVLGGNGMLGHQIVRVLSASKKFKVYATDRSGSMMSHKDTSQAVNFITDFNAEHLIDFETEFLSVSPDVVINCIGLVKQHAHSLNNSKMILLNSLFPHQLNDLCKKIDAYLIHFSTDCVFSGKKGNYRESDFPDATDLYGRSKLLGEVYSPRALTLRTSIIGHELSGKLSLLEWFLAQKNSCKGFKNAFFSGLPANEIALIIRDYLVHQQSINGVYHVASHPISKYNLLSLIAAAYQMDINIIPVDEPVIDRSLCGVRFEKETGFLAPCWSEMIKRMHEYG